VESKFTVVRRNYGHWDIFTADKRVFRLRGGPGSYVVLDERGEVSTRDEPIEFNSTDMAMAYICGKLMFELIVAEGQDHQEIEAWNIS